jgi:hypothetical protein
VKINKFFSEVKLESRDTAIELASKIGISIPPDYISFRALIGGIRLDQVDPFLVLHPFSKKLALAEFSHFHDYDAIYHHQKRILDFPEYTEYEHEKKKSLLRIGSCEEQVDIFMGYGKNNLNVVYIYIVEEGLLEEVGNLENFINNYLVAYSEEFL